MPVYCVAALTKTNEQNYAQYVETAKRSLAPYPDARLAADDNATIVEGIAPGSRFVLLQFEDEATFWKWYNSPDYNEAKPWRFSGADTNFLALVKGH